MMPRMDFEPSDRTRDFAEKLTAFMDERVYPAEDVYEEQLREAGDPHGQPPIMEELKEEARSRGLWNLFHPDAQYGPGLSYAEYAPLAESTGRSHLGPEAVNCAAPDTGNMEVLTQFGTDDQKEQWLRPLLDGEIRSAFAMTEPAVASSDATNIELRIERDGDEYVLNGRKWWISGAMKERCRIFIVMGKTNRDGPPHQQQSMILVPRDTPGLTVLRNMQVFGYTDNEGHAELRLEDVRVPASNLIAGEGDGFLISQARLGPGRIHHCMRSIGVAERALELMCIDTVGNKHARTEVAAIKVAAPDVALRVLDRAIQVHGGGGVSQDFPLARMYAHLRTLRLADGPDEVHKMTIARRELRRWT